MDSRDLGYKLELTGHKAASVVEGAMKGAAFWGMIFFPCEMRSNKRSISSKIGFGQFFKFLSDFLFFVSSVLWLWCVKTFSFFGKELTVGPGLVSIMCRGKLLAVFGSCRGPRTCFTVDPSFL